MEPIIFGVILSFLITIFAIPKIIYVSEKKKLFDTPDDVRKLHKKPVSSLGGLGIFLGFILSLLLTVNCFQAAEFQFYIACFILMFFVGIKDDMVELSAVKKFIGQALVAFILMFKAHLVITDMHGFFGLTTIYPTFSYFLTFFTIIVIINAFNLIDGVDGLAGSLGVISCVFFGSFFWLNGNLPYAMLAFAFAGSLLAFLIYNFQPAKIFMGDTGSLLLGVISSILVLKFIETGASSATYPVGAAPAIGFGILLLPLLDTLRVFGYRMLHRRSPFSADRNHLHHLLLDRGLSHRNVTLGCAGASILFSAAVFTFQAAGTTVLIIGLVLTFAGGIYTIMQFPLRSMRVIKTKQTRSLDPVGDNYAPAKVV